MSRKYRQRGYQDDEPRESRHPPRASGQRPEGPRGRGLGKPTVSTFRCARCGSKQVGSEVDSEAVCAACGSALHTCTNCRFFDSAAPNECRAEIVERIAGKSSRNDCTQFESKVAQETAAESPAPGDARAEFDALFDF
jgi:hypothetical protein